MTPAEKVRHRVVRWFTRQGFLDTQAATDTLASGRPSMYPNLYFRGQVRNVKMADQLM